MYNKMWADTCLQICPSSPDMLFSLHNKLEYSQFYPFPPQSYTLLLPRYSQKPTLPSTKKAKLNVTHSISQPLLYLYLSLLTFEGSSEREECFWRLISSAIILKPSTHSSSGISQQQLSIFFYLQLLFPVYQHA